MVWKSEAIGPDDPLAIAARMIQRLAIEFRKEIKKLRRLKKRGAR
jgi:hypothetical protein